MRVRLWAASVDLAETREGGEEADDEIPGKYTRVRESTRIQWKTQINRQAAGNQHSVAPHYGNPVEERGGEQCQ